MSTILNRGKRGFLLIEMAMVIILFSMIRVAFYHLFRQSHQILRRLETNIQLEDIKDALLRYYDEKNVLPYPEPFEKSDILWKKRKHCPEEENFEMNLLGKEMRNDFFKRNYLHVFIGYVPLEGLNLTKKNDRDGYGNKIIYIMWGLAALKKEEVYIEYHVDEKIEKKYPFFEHYFVLNNISNHIFSKMEEITRKSSVDAIDSYPYTLQNYQYLKDNLIHILYHEDEKNLSNPEQDFPLACILISLPHDIEKRKIFEAQMATLNQDEESHKFFITNCQVIKIYCKNILSKKKFFVT
jgi:Tfp pilus assembly protein PilE